MNVVASHIVTATDTDGLQRIAEVIHDEPFMPGELEFSRDTGVVRILFGRAAGEQQAGICWYHLVWSHHTYPLAAHRLEVHHVSNVIVSGAVDSDEHTFRDIRLHGHAQLLLTSNEGCAIVLSVDRIYVAVTRLASLYGTRDVWYVCGVEIERNRRICPIGAQNRRRQ